MRNAVVNIHFNWFKVDNVSVSEPAVHLIVSSSHSEEGDFTKLWVIFTEYLLECLQCFLSTVDSLANRIHSMSLSHLQSLPFKHSWRETIYTALSKLRWKTFVGYKERILEFGTTRWHHHWSEGCPLVPVLLNLLWAEPHKQKTHHTQSNNSTGEDGDCLPEKRVDKGATNEHIRETGAIMETRTEWRQDKVQTQEQERTRCQTRRETQERKWKTRSWWNPKIIHARRNRIQSVGVMSRPCVYRP